MNVKTLDRSKLAKILGMLGSSHDGEIAAAGRQADKLIRECGLTWAEVLNLNYRELYVIPEVNSDDQDMVNYLIEHEERLTNWEYDFVYSISDWLKKRRRLTERQSEVLEDVYNRVRERSR